MQPFIWVIIVGVILVLAIIFLAIGLRFYLDWQGCLNEFSPWCFNDWRCPNYPASDPRHFPARNAYANAASCSQGSSYKCKVAGL
jgi:hypothetical protein